VTKPAAVARRVTTPPTATKEPGETGSGRGELPDNFSGHDLPGLRIDVQIHIDAEATADQIAAVFASMAKHLYGRE
jgi:hypothetical protein